MKGILFRPEMVSAIVNGSKVLTRRVIKPQPVLDAGGYYWNFYSKDGGRVRVAFNSDNQQNMARYARYRVGEVVYIKEALCFHKSFNLIELQGQYKHGLKSFFYDLDCAKGVQDCLENKTYRKLSPLFMPAWAARRFLRITGIRGERLQNITEKDAKAEGAEALYKTAGAGYIWTPHGYRDGFVRLWDSINPKHPWASNPWCFVYTFRLVDKPIDKGG